MEGYDFCGWATKNDVQCSDGRYIRHNAFKDCDGTEVPLVWNHDHSNPENVLGKVVLQNRPEGVFCYGYFNDTTKGQVAKTLVQHGDITNLSIFASKVKQVAKDVIHGFIKEVSLVHAGANPEAFIEDVVAHSENEDGSFILYLGEVTEDDIAHSDEDPEEPEYEEITDEEELEDEDEDEDDEYEDDEELESEFDEEESEEESEEDELEDEEISHADKDDEGENDKKNDAGKSKSDEGDTVEEVYNTLTPKQKIAVDMIVQKSLEIAQSEFGHSLEDNEEETEMKHNIFETGLVKETTLSHADQEALINLAKNSTCGTLKNAITMFRENSDEEEVDCLAHSIDSIDEMFPEYKNLDNGEPETLTRDMSWVSGVINGVKKSPFSRIRTRQLDARYDVINAKGYKKGHQKTNIGNVKLLKRTTDPQTVYVRDGIDRDDIIDITDFDVVAYQYKIMRMALNEELAKAILIGDGREDGDEDKISEEHIRSIWHDDDLYTIHKDVDIEAAREEIQGSDTSKHFGDNYIYAEAIIAAALDARIDYKGSGSLKFYCTPQLLNKMLLARDLNGRRIYNSKTDLQAALNVSAIETVEQFQGLTREDATSHKTKELLGLFVNFSDYQVGSTKGGEITKFEDFDIDFNKYKYLMETRLSGALIRPYSAIALEMVVNP